MALPVHWRWRFSRVLFFFVLADRNKRKSYMIILKYDNASLNVTVWRVLRPFARSSYIFITIHKYNYCAREQNFIFTYPSRTNNILRIIGVSFRRFFFFQCLYPTSDTDFEFSAMFFLLNLVQMSNSFALYTSNRSVRMYLAGNGRTDIEWLLFIIPEFDYPWGIDDEILDFQSYNSEIKFFLFFWFLWVTSATQTEYKKNRYCYCQTGMLEQRGRVT